MHLLKNGKKKKVWVESKGVRGLMVWFLAIFSIILCGVVFSFYFFLVFLGLKIQLMNCNFNLLSLNFVILAYYFW